VTREHFRRDFLEENKIKFKALSTYFAVGSVGPGEGNMVGRLEGNGVGIVLGATVGTTEGRGVGPWVVGNRVGDAEGTVVG